MVEATVSRRNRRTGRTRRTGVARIFRSASDQVQRGTTPAVPDAGSRGFVQWHTTCLFAEHASHPETGRAAQLAHFAAVPRGGPGTLRQVEIRNRDLQCKSNSRCVRRSCRLSSSAACCWRWRSVDARVRERVGDVVSGGDGLTPVGRPDRRPRRSAGDGGPASEHRERAAAHLRGRRRGAVRVHGQDVGSGQGPNDQEPMTKALPTPKHPINLQPLGVGLGVGSWECLGSWELVIGN